MTRLERLNLRRAMAQQKYGASQRSVMDRLVDQARRAKATRAAGHLLTCTLTRCDERCPSLRR